MPTTTHDSVRIALDDLRRLEAERHAEERRLAAEREAERVRGLLEARAREVAQTERRAREEAAREEAERHRLALARLDGERRLGELRLELERVAAERARLASDLRMRELAGLHASDATSRGGALRTAGIVVAALAACAGAFAVGAALTTPSSAAPMPTMAVRVDVPRPVTSPETGRVTTVATGTVPPSANAEDADAVGRAPVAAVARTARRQGDDGRSPAATPQARPARTAAAASLDDGCDPNDPICEPAMSETSTGALRRNGGARGSRGAHVPRSGARSVPVDELP